MQNRSSTQSRLIAPTVLTSVLSHLLVVLALVVALPTRSEAQGFLDQMKRAAQGFASGASEMAMAKASPLDLDTRELPTVPLGALAVGVSQADVKDGVGVRVHVYYHNPTDQPVSIALPNDQTFALVDSKGRRLQFISLKLQGVAKGATQLTVPALERATLTLMFHVPNTDAPDAILKVGSAGMIRGIPLLEIATPATPPAATPAASTPAAPPAQPPTTGAPDAPAPTDVPPAAPPAAAPAAPPR